MSHSMNLSSDTARTDTLHTWYNPMTDLYHGGLWHRRTHKGGPFDGNFGTFLVK